MKRTFIGAFIIFFIFTSLAFAQTAVDTYQISESRDLELSYKFSSHVLNENEYIELTMPSKYSSKNLEFIAITHRQSPNEERECRSFSDKDCLPAYTSVEVYDANLGWRYWAGAGSGPFNSKFAEIRGRYNGETDNLYHWRLIGHIGFDRNDKSTAALNIQKVRIRNLGPDSSKIENLVVRFSPDQNIKTTDFIFSSEMVFGDYQTAAGERLLKTAYYGDYKNALTLTPRKTPNHKNLPNQWQLAKGEIHIPICCNQKLAFVDIAIGDMKYSGRSGNLDDYRGQAKLSVYILYPDSRTEVLTENENVGTTGVLRATPYNISKPIPDGSYLVVKVDKDTAQIMGIRLGTNHDQK